MTYDMRGCLVSVPADKLVVLQGLKDTIVVETDDILLVCKMEDEQKIKNFVNDVRILKGTDYV
jgi:mannose-1-phosphate guanylyltransferase